MPNKLTLKAARVNVGLTQEKAADKLGVSVSTLKNWENGHSSPTVQNLSKICELYHVSYDHIFFGREIS